MAFYTYIAGLGVTNLAQTFTHSLGAGFPAGSLSTLSIGVTFATTPRSGSARSRITVRAISTALTSISRPRKAACGAARRAVPP